ncbi:amyloid beta protein binding protein 1 [Tremella mesenterica]|uniref:NEDD8-activating enzyme E1 regulatory subunit n=1 Tax=Tremella mesenterica TaxID=5217 RepID=A0A4Q1BN04_TREME|nr:amyloid beta protein binding protein 1 [Tremella mesenterica]
MAKMQEALDVNEAITATQVVPSYVFPAPSSFLPPKSWVSTATVRKPLPRLRYRPDAKTRRYDRQLRLWASSGQKSLEQARILLVGCDATGCQALKNLVLPGISHFTILSSNVTTSQDVATNFFLHPTSIGRPIASEAVRHLKELNPAVEGESNVNDPTILLETNPEFFLSFTLIITSNLPPSLELQIADLLWSGPDIPLIGIRSSGFIGRVEIQLREHCIVDTHPETNHTLRIYQPFPALEEYAVGLDIDGMDSMDYSHIPWVVLLVRLASQWKKDHGGNLPNNDEEKTAFKQLLKSGKRKGDEENFDEALTQVYRVWNKSDVSYEIKSLMEDESIKNISVNSKNLHILLHTLSQYLLTPPHLPPLSPTLPDMHSSTTSYIVLQNLFKRQHRSDLQLFRQTLSSTLEKIGLPEDAIPDQEVEGFVRNIGGVGIVKGSSLSERRELKGLIVSTIEESFAPGGYLSIPCAMHFALMACERYYSLYGGFPGSGEGDDVAEDTRKVEEIVGEMVRGVVSLQILPDEVIESIAEIIRGGFGTLPTTAALLGGVVAQETIKLITAQYAPLDNTVVFDLIKSQSEKWKF